MVSTGTHTFHSDATVITDIGKLQDNTFSTGDRWTACLEMAHQMAYQLVLTWATDGNIVAVWWYISRWQLDTGCTMTRTTVYGYSPHYGRTWSTHRWGRMPSVTLPLMYWYGRENLWLLWFQVLRKYQAWDNGVWQPGPVEENPYRGRGHLLLLPPFRDWL